MADKNPPSFMDRVKTLGSAAADVVGAAGDSISEAASDAIEKGSEVYDQAADKVSKINDDKKYKLAFGEGDVVRNLTIDQVIAELNKVGIELSEEK